MPSHYHQEEAADVLAPYSKDREVAVAYDPANPDRAVLESGVSLALWKQALIPPFLGALSFCTSSTRSIVLIAASCSDRIPSDGRSLRAE